MGITAVDPIGMDLLFERFLSEERNQWPDIDLDLPSGDRRERVIQYVYERYGQLGVGMTANVITYRGRSAARDVGKVLSIPLDQINRLAKGMDHFEWTDPEELLQEDRYLVLNYTPAELAVASSDERRAWEDSMDVACAVADHAEAAQQSNSMDCSDFVDLQHPFLEEQNMTRGTIPFFFQ